MNYTKGEWKMHSMGHGIAVIRTLPEIDYYLARLIDCGDEQIASVVWGTPEREGNAYLISAAPDMYEALVAGRSAIATLGIMIGLSEAHSKEFAKIINSFDKALAKAEGKEEK